MTNQILPSPIGIGIGSPLFGDAPPTAVGFSYLAPDALLAYCQTELQNVDSRMEGYFQNEQSDAGQQQAIATLTTTINDCTQGGIDTTKAHAAMDLLSACQTAIDSVGANTPAGQQLVNLRDSMAKAIDPSGRLQAHLDGPGGGDATVKNYQQQLAQNPGLTDSDFVGSVGGTGGALLNGPQVQSWASSATSISSDIGNDSQMGMIQLQSLMSDRSTSIQMCTNLVQSLADQTKGITSNIGH